MKHVELFSGIGGFRQAMRLLALDEGPQFDCVAFSEIDAAATKTYKANFDTSREIELGDIVTFVDNPQKNATLPHFDLLTGGFPCQAFSMMGAQRGFEDARGTLFFSIAKMLQIYSPKYVLLENVKNLKTHDKGKTYKVIVQTLESLGYSVWADVFNTANFGLPQIRNRVYIFATREKVKSEFQFSAGVVQAFFENLPKTSLMSNKSTIDLLRKEVQEKYWLSNKIKRTILANGSGGFVGKSEIDLDIARPLCATMAKMHRACQDNYFSEEFIVSRGRNRYMGGIEESESVRIRRLIPEEAFELQGFNSDFVCNVRKQFGVADSCLYKQAGNAVSVNVVYAILAYLSESFKWS